MHYQRVDQLPRDLVTLLHESRLEGHHMLERLQKHWLDGTNRYARPGEALFAAFESSAVVGVCGLNHDPYTRAPRVGRVRHLYVLPATRRQGVASALVQLVVTHAKPHFELLRVRTDSPVAAAFYAANGFSPMSGEPHATHVLDLTADLVR